MDVMDAIMSRRSIRKYKSTPISEEDLNAVLDVGTPTNETKLFTAFLRNRRSGGIDTIAVKGIIAQTVYREN